MPAVGDAVRPRGAPHERHLYDDGNREIMYIRHGGNWIITGCVIAVPGVFVFAFLMWFLFSHLH